MQLLAKYRPMGDEAVTSNARTAPLLFEARSTR
jgi:hypothetical protein